MSGECERVQEQAGRGELAPELRVHVDTCVDCRERLAASESLGRLRGPDPAEAMLSRIQAQALAEFREKPRVPPWWRDALLLVGFSGLMGLTGAVMMSPARGAHPPYGALELIGEMVLLSLVMVGGAVLALAPGVWRIRPLILVGVLLTALSMGLGGSGLADGRAFALTGLRCMMGEWVVSLPPWALSLWMLRRVAIQPLRTLCAGLSAGVAGLLALHLFCPIGTAAHLLLFHVVPWLALAALAVPLRRRLPSRAYAP